MDITVYRANELFPKAMKELYRTSRSKKTFKRWLESSKDDSWMVVDGNLWVQLLGAPSDCWDVYVPDVGWMDYSDFMARKNKET